MANINKELNQIKNAVYGKDVRQAIHDGIEKAYNDATSGGAGDTDLEVVLASGNYDALNKRLDASESQLKDEGQERENDFNDLNYRKADESYVDDKISNLDGLKIKGGFDTVEDLESAYPDGTEALYVVGDYLYAWNGR